MQMIYKSNVNVFSSANFKSKSYSYAIGNDWEITRQDQLS